MFHGDRVTRDMVADAIRRAVDEVVIEQLHRKAQEPAINAKVAQSIEMRLSGQMFNGYRVTVKAQDFADRGPRSAESRCGADLYLAIRVDHDFAFMDPIAKGLLVQAKMDPPRLYKQGGIFLKSIEAEQKRLVEQCEKMLGRTSDRGAFVWYYDRDGAGVVAADEIIAHRRVPAPFLQRKGIGDHFRDILDCFQGDRRLAHEEIFGSGQALGQFMEEIAVPHAVAIDILRVDRD